MEKNKTMHYEIWSSYTTNPTYFAKRDIATEFDASSDAEAIVKAREYQSHDWHGMTYALRTKWGRLVAISTTGAYCITDVSRIVPIAKKCFAMVKEHFDFDQGVTRIQGVDFHFFGVAGKVYMDNYYMGYFETWIDLVYAIQYKLDWQKGLIK